MYRTAIAFLVVFSAIGVALQALAAPLTADNTQTLIEEGRVEVGFYPDALLFLSDARLAVINSENAYTVIWNVSASGAEAVEEPQMGKILAVSDDLSTLAVCTRAGAVAMWSADLLEETFDLCTLHNTPFPQAAFSPDGRLLAITNERDEIELWDLETRTRTATLIGHDSNIFDIAFSPDGSLLATAGGWSGSATDEDSCVKVWDVATGAPVVSLPTIDIMDNHAIAFGSDGACLISGGSERLVVWDASTWERAYDSGPSYPGSYGLAVSPNQELLALAYWGGSIRLVDLNTMQVLRSLPAPNTPFDVAFSPDGTRLAASFSDGTVIVWKTP